MEAYYYERLDKEKKSVYYPLFAGLKAMQTSIAVPKVEAKTLSDIYFLIRMDHPDIFYTTTFRFRSSPQASAISVEPDYLFDRKKLRTHIDAMRARTEKLARPVMGRSEAEKLQYVHDFICGNVRYDKLKKEYSHEIIGPLGQGVGVCEGIAKTVKQLCDALGVWCIVALSGSNPDKGVKYRHTWNVVRIDGRFYHLDATFDNSLSDADGIRYDYYLLSDRQHYRDHEPVIWPVPACSDADRSYYREKKLSFTKTEDVQKRAAQALKKNRTLIFHWRGSHLTRERLAELTQIMEREAAAAGKTIRITVNLPQAVLRMIPGTSAAGPVVMEQANGGGGVKSPAPPAAAGLAFFRDRAAVRCG